MLNKTLKVNDEKTESAPSLTIWVLLSVLLLVLIKLFVPPLNIPSLVMGGERFSVQVVDTDIEREKGLSGMSSLGTNEAMLFVLDEPSEQCIWMKDMNFPIDIIWLNSAKQVVYIEESVIPSTYPKNFCPDSASLYVIEANAGVVERLNISRGQTVNF